jgi:hypothetical protein
MLQSIFLKHTVMAFQIAPGKGREAKMALSRIVVAFLTAFSREFLLIETSDILSRRSSLT